MLIAFVCLVTLSKYNVIYSTEAMSNVLPAPATDQDDQLLLSERDESAPQLGGAHSQPGPTQLYGMYSSLCTNGLKLSANICSGERAGLLVKLI